MARTTAGRMERHIRNAPHVDPDSWQDSAQTHPTSKSLVERYPICHASWTYNIHYVSQRSTLPNRLRGLTTSTMSHKGRHFQIDFDFIAHLLIIEMTDGSSKTIALQSRSVADFYQEITAALESLGVSVNIWTTPSEVPDRIPFEQNRKHSTYDPEYANRFWRILVEASRVFTDFVPGSSER